MDINLLGQQAWQQYLNSCQTQNLEIPSQPDFLSSAPSIFAISQFILNFATRHPVEFNDLVTSQHLLSTQRDAQKYNQDIKKIITFSENEIIFQKEIRIYRYKESVRIAWQHCLYRETFERLAVDISELAIALIQAAHDYHAQALILEIGIENPPPAMLILGMGKLGAKELNFSSDIDLIFLYDKDERFKGRAGKQITAQQFYTRLGQKLINSLHQIQADGFVYRVDMRLRPFGDSGPLAMSLKAFDDYCHKQGRDWERYAMIKAQCLTGSNAHKEQLEQIIHDFVYRPYHDYKMGDAIRKMKEKIMREMKKTHQNIKLGRGGIREAEFIVQSYQLIYGGQNAQLCSPPIKETAFALVEADLISKQDARQLYQGYVLLRNVENSLQILKEQQTHTLPNDPIQQYLIAQSLGYTAWPPLAEEIEETRQTIQALFDRLTHFSSEEEIEDLTQQIIDISHTSHLEPHENTEPKLDTIIAKFEKKIAEKNYPEESISITSRLIPIIKSHLLAHPHWNLERVLNSALKFIQKVLRRPTYLYLLEERPLEISTWLQLIELGNYFSTELEQHPFLLERALNPREKHQIYLQPGTYVKKLTESLQQVSAQTMEESLEAVRRFRLSQLFNIAVAKSLGKITLMESADIMSSLAESITINVLENAWDDVFEKENILPEIQNLLRDNLAIVAYGKLGGLELGFSSDIDIIFLYSEENIEACYKKLFTRTAQRFVSLMQANTYSGKLYEVDLRLRPEGNSGLLVSSISSFIRYQQKSAWLWEHQALVRARWMTGSPENIKLQFEQVRRDLLQKHYRNATLKQGIVDMRVKMRTELLRNTKSYDIKQSPGGMVDIEFLAQYFALTYTQQYPQIGYFTDNIRIFESMETAGLLTLEETADLVNSYCYYRDLTYHCYFKNEAALVDYNQVAGYPEKILTLWNKYLKET